MNSVKAISVSSIRFFSVRNSLAGSRFACHADAIDTAVSRSHRLGSEYSLKELSAHVLSAFLESTMPLESYLPASTQTSQSAIFRTWNSARTGKLPQRFLCMSLLQSTANFVLHKSKVTERTLCLATHVLSSIRSTQCSFCTGSGFADVVNSFVELRRLFDNTPDDFALW